MSFYNGAVLGPAQQQPTGTIGEVRNWDYRFVDCDTSSMSIETLFPDRPCGSLTIHKDCPVYFCFSTLIHQIMCAVFWRKKIGRGILDIFPVIRTHDPFGSVMILRFKMTRSAI